MTDPAAQTFLDRIKAIHPTPLDKPLEETLAKLVQALVMDELAAGRKVYPMNDWIKFTMEGDRVSSVDIKLRFKAP